MSGKSEFLDSIILDILDFGKLGIPEMTTLLNSQILAEPKFMAS